MIKKIHICGIYGCGKTTLAKNFSRILNIPYYSLDDIKYIRKYSKIRPVEERIKIVEGICNTSSWITEGSWSDYAKDSFKKADIIILMNTPKLICNYRILKRYFNRNKNGKYENDTFFEALKLTKEVFKYHFTKNPVSLHAHKNLINKYKKKCIVIKKNSEIPFLINKIINNN